MSDSVPACMPAADQTEAKTPAISVTSPGSNDLAASARIHRYEVLPQRSGPHFKVRYREGSLPAGECRLCQS